MRPENVVAYHSVFAYNIEYCEKNTEELERK